VVRRAFIGRVGVADAGCRRVFSRRGRTRHGRNEAAIEKLATVTSVAPRFTLSTKLHRLARDQKSVSATGSKMRPGRGGSEDSRMIIEILTCSRNSISLACGNRRASRRERDSARDPAPEPLRTGPCGAGIVPNRKAVARDGRDPRSRRAAGQSLRRIRSREANERGQNRSMPSKSEDSSFSFVRRCCCQSVDAAAVASAPPT